MDMIFSINVVSELKRTIKGMKPSASIYNKDVLGEGVMFISLRWTHSLYVLKDTHREINKI